MSKKFCPDQAQQLIKFLYKETTERERADLLPGIFEDAEQKEVFDDLLDTKTQLDSLSSEEWLSIAAVPRPSASCTTNIMRAIKELGSN